ncbi:hypothetical protein [Flagellimonas allohymeniacidonis]|uniref:Uncharacterized protein n=1 Tax=Flagellimonas allohymeniacidonis TaxID=2517819 RepID=A0A4Q8QAX8_9FLAO|nr:hypothetical protein [Allomuricauda hymeniacidonis]TAI47421.1 hypothetical protein EW142_12170 [Allomuricauda hymeniacidonis]
MKKLGAFLLVLLCLSCSPPPNANNEWRIVLKTDREGKVLKGSKQNLVNAVRNGADLKIGWGVKREDLSIEHLASPIWLAILSEQEVMAHLDPQVLSGINWGDLNASYKDSTLLHKEWRVVLTTKGDFDAIWYDRKVDSVIRRWPQKHSMTWFAKGDSKETLSPLFSTSP